MKNRKVIVLAFSVIAACSSRAPLKMTTTVLTQSTITAAIHFSKAGTLEICTFETGQCTSPKYLKNVAINFDTQLLTGIDGNDNKDFAWDLQFLENLP